MTRPKSTLHCGVGAFLLLAIAGNLPAQTPIWNPANGHTYFVTPVTFYWTEARALAATFGGHLATINDAAEQAWIQSAVLPTDAVWIGLNDELQNTVYAWESGEPVTYTNWCPGEPNSSGADNFVAMQGASMGCTGKWNDAGNVVLRAIVEIPTTTATEPVIWMVTPGFGPSSGGTPVTIDGLNLLGTTAVTIGGLPLQNVVVVSATRITGVTPPSSIGPKDLVICGSGSCGSRSGAFVSHPVPLGADLAVNGSFEQGPALAPNSTWCSCFSTDPYAMPGWTILPTIDILVAPAWQPADGQRSLDLNGNSAGGVTQTLSTIPGRTYMVSWKMSGNPGLPYVELLQVDAAGQSVVHFFDSAGLSIQNMNWSARCWTFTATSASTSLRFQSLVPISWGGPALDDVRVYDLFGPLRIAGPLSTPIGTPVVWSIDTAPPAPFAAYLFEVSFSGDTPGLALPPPLQGPLPLNPPFLRFTYEPVFPFLFQDFAGLLDATGHATATFRTPAYPGLAGVNLYAACVTFDPAGPLGFGSISNGARTTFVNPSPTTPSVASVSPPDGPIAGQSTITVTGTGFVPGASVAIDGVPCTSVVVQNATTIACVTPAGTHGPKTVAVTNPGGQIATLAGGFAYLPNLSLASVSPIVASAGTAVTLSGAGFQTGLQLSVGSLAVVPNSVTATQVVFTMPAGVPCATQVAVANPSGQTGSRPFNPSPSIAATPGAVGPASGGTTFFLIGANYFPGTTVTVGGAPATILALSPGAIVAVSPPSTAGLAPIVVSSLSGCTALSSFLYQ